MADPTKGPKDPNEPILREEYERRHKSLRESYEAFASRSMKILVFLVVVVLATGGLSAYLLHENSERTKENAKVTKQTAKVTKKTSKFSLTLSENLIESCRTNGNPLRKAVRQFGETLGGQIEQDIAQSKALERAGTYEEIFPQYPSDKLHELLRKNRAEERKAVREINEAIASIEAVNCYARFPPPPQAPPAK